MRRPLIVANWKMHGTRRSAEQLLTDLLVALGSVNSVDVAVCPSYIYIPLAEQLLSGSSVGWGAQNLSDQEVGAYTGEISGSMLAEFGCRYVIVGHSERRSIYGESDDVVAAKFLRAQADGLTPILCVGETLEQYRNGATLEVVAGQLSAVLDLAGISAMRSAVIAYEPVWAIGTGETATPDQAQKVHAHLRGLLADLDQDVAASAAVLYGGSVKAANAQSLFAMADIDGALVGGASLDAKEFAAICSAA